MSPSHKLVARRFAVLSESEKEQREDERLVRRSPESKPPRRDLERGRVKDKDTSEKDPDVEQDKRDRSQNYKDASSTRIALRYLLRDKRVAFAVNATGWSEFMDQMGKKKVKAPGRDEEVQISTLASSENESDRAIVQGMFEKWKEGGEEEGGGSDSPESVPTPAPTPAPDSPETPDQPEEPTETPEEKERREAEENKIITDLEGDEAREMEKKLNKETMDSKAYYDTLSAGDRQSARMSLDEDIKSRPKGSAKRMELEAKRRGLIVSSVLNDGDEASGVGPSMAMLLKAADKKGKIKEFMELNLTGGDPASENNQKELRGYLEALDPSEIDEMLPDDHVAKKLFTDPGKLSRMSPEVQKEMYDMVVDSVMGDIVFTDANLSEKFPSDNVGELKKKKSKIPKPPAMESIWERLGDLLKSISESGEKR